MISKGNIRRLVLLATIQCAAMALTACGDKEDKKVVERSAPLLTSENIGLSEKNEQSDKKAEHQKLLSEIFGKEGFDLKTHPNGENKEGYLQQDAVAHLDSGEMFDKVTLDDKPIVERTRNSSPKDGVVYTNWKVEEFTVGGKKWGQKNLGGHKVASAFVYSQDKIPVVDGDDYNRYDIVLRVNKNKENGLITNMTLFNPNGFQGNYGKRFPIKVKVDEEVGRTYNVMLDQSGMIAEFHDFMIKDMFKTYDLNFVHMLNLRKKMYVQYMDKNGVEQQVEFNIQSIPF